MEVTMKDLNECALDWDDEESKIGGFGLVGKLVSNRPINRTTFRKSITRSWNVRGKLEIGFLDDNVYTFQFEDKLEHDRVLRDSPWAVDGLLLNLRPWSPVLTVKEVLSSKCVYWVQAHDLPPKIMTRKNIVKIGSMTGEVICFEDPKIDDLLFRDFARIRVEVDLSKPLIAGVWVPRPELDKVWVAFKYEKLQGFCYNCGRVGHDYRVCDNERVMSEKDPSKPMFSAELRANPVKTISTVVMIREGEYASVQMVSARDSSSSRRSMEEEGSRVGDKVVGLMVGQEGKDSVKSLEEGSAKGVLGGLDFDMDYEDVTSPIKTKTLPLVKDNIVCEIGSMLSKTVPGMVHVKNPTVTQAGASRRFKDVPGNCRKALFTTPVDKSVSAVSEPYIVELPEENEVDRVGFPLRKFTRFLRQPVLQLTYEKALVQKFEKVNLKRAMEESEDKENIKKLKVDQSQFKVEVNTGSVTFAKGKDLVTKIEKQRGKKTNSGVKSQNSGLIEIPVMEVNEINIKKWSEVSVSKNFVFSAVGHGGQPQMATTSP